MTTRIGVLSGLGRERRAVPRFCSGVAAAVLLAVAGLAGAAPLVAKEKPPTIYQIPLPPTADFSALDWLLGEWAGKTADPNGVTGEMRISVSYELDKRIMLLRAQASFEATTASPATNESWMGILVRDRGGSGFLLSMYSSRGFITRYRLAVEGPEIHVSPEGGEQPPPGWLFRAIIQRTDSEEFMETVQAAPPAKPFFDYYTVKLSRVRAQGQDKTKKTAAAAP